MTTPTKNRDYRSPGAASARGSLLGCAVALVALALLVWILAVALGGALEPVTKVLG